MLSLEQIIKISKMPVPDQSYKPGVLTKAMTDETSESARFVLGYRNIPGGDITIAQYDSKEEMLADPDHVPMS